MGMDNEYASAVVFDLETLPIEGAVNFIEPIEAPLNFVDPTKIRDYIQKATLKAAEKCSTDPDLCRIAVLGWLPEGDTEPIVLRAEDEAQERAALGVWWDMVTTPGGSHRRTISFYGLSFDWPVIIQRSRYLGLLRAWPNLDKYRTPHVDLFNVLTFHGSTKHSHGLSFYAKRFGLDLPEDPIDGSQIAAVIAAGDWAAAEQHCRLDVLKTAMLAQRLGLMAPAHEAVCR